MLKLLVIQTNIQEDFFKRSSCFVDMSFTIQRHNDGTLTPDTIAWSDYMRFVNNVRENTDRGIELKEAVNMAVHYCQESGIMVDLLSKHEGEVKDMVFTEFDQEQYLKNRREEWLEEGRTEAIYSLVRSGMLSKENAAGHLRISVAELETGMAKEESAAKCQ